MKRVFATVMLCLVLSQTVAHGIGDSFHTSTGEPAPETGGVTVPTEPEADKVIWSINPPDNTYIVLLERGSEVNAEVLALPTEAVGIYNQWDGVQLPVQWDLSDVNADTPGWLLVEGVAQLPQGFVFPGGDLSVQYYAYVYDPEQVGVETLIDAQTVLYGVEGIFSLGSEYAELEAAFQRLKPKHATYTLLDPAGNSHSFLLPITYDLSLVDLNTEGRYNPFSPPPAYFQYDTKAVQAISLYVLDPNVVDLRTWRISGFGQFIADWIYEIEAPALWTSVDGGAWQHADLLVEQGYNVYPDYAGYAFGENYLTGKYNRVYIDTTALIEGHTYEFEVRYENDGVSVNSFVLDLTDGHFPQYGNGGGSRAGDDREEVVDPPTYVPDPPAPQEKATGRPFTREEALYLRSQWAKLAHWLATLLPPRDRPQKEPAAAAVHQEDVLLPASTQEATPTPSVSAAEPSSQPSAEAAPGLSEALLAAMPPRAQSGGAGYTQTPTPPPASQLPEPSTRPASSAAVASPTFPPAALEVPSAPSAVQEAAAVPAADTPATRRNIAAVVAVGGVALAGTALLWHMVGKHLVKRP